MQGWYPSPASLAQSTASKEGEGIKVICYSPSLTDIAPGDFFSFGEWSLASRCPRTASRWACKGSSEPSPKRSLLTRRMHRCEKYIFVGSS
jgi:hypothetical protein